MKLFKIAFSGTHCTGKSKIVQLLSENLTNCSVIDEVFRESWAKIESLGLEKLKQSEDLTLHTFHSQILKEIETHSNHKILLADRTAFDCFVYHRVLNKGNYESLSFKQTRRLALAHLENYDKIFISEPFDAEIEDDGFRHKDKAFQMLIYRYFLRAYKDRENVVFFDKTVTTDDKLNIILKLLKQN